MSEFDWEAFWKFLLEKTENHRVIQPFEYSQVYPMNDFLNLMKANFLFDEDDTL